MTPDDVLRFWREAGEERWFGGGPVFDGTIAVRFKQAVAEAQNGAFTAWEEDSTGRLGLIVLLDQFARNIHRGSPLAFAGDRRALALAKRAVARGDHRRIPAPLALWFVMPFEHSEDLDDQHRAVGLFQSMGLNEMVHWAQIHLDIVEKFGRFPHRNRILGRKSTPAELAFLAAGGFSG